MKRYLLTGLTFISGCAIVCAMFWLYGFDFNSRGETAFLVFYLSLTVGGFSAAGVWTAAGAK